MHLLDNTGQQHRTQLQYITYMPSYPHNIFLVARATNGGAIITSKKRDSHMVTKDGIMIDIHESCDLIIYKLLRILTSVRCIKPGMKFWATVTIKTFKNYSVVKGMQIKGNTGKPAQVCEVCIQGKFTQSTNSEPDNKAKEPLQWVHTDLAVPMQIPSIGGY